MGLYREKYSLIGKPPEVSELKKILEFNTGLVIEFEVHDQETFFIYCDKFKLSVEIGMDCKNYEIYFYFPLKKKGYFEYSIFNVFSPYLEGVGLIPGYAKKKWKDLSFLEKMFKK